VNFLVASKEIDRVAVAVGQCPEIIVYKKVIEKSNFNETLKLYTKISTLFY
jgi:hypothetical protein